MLADIHVCVCACHRTRVFILALQWMPACQSWPAQMAKSSRKESMPCQSDAAPLLHKACVTVFRVYCVVSLTNCAAHTHTHTHTGATFAKFRAVLKLDEHLGHPSQRAIQLNATTLARYASLAQEAGLVPIVEPEVSVFDGSNSIDVSAKVTQEVMSSVFRALVVHNVVLEVLWTILM